MNLHKFFHRDEIFSCPCVLDSKDGVLSRITNVPSNDAIATRTVGVSVFSNLVAIPEPKPCDYNDRMPSARQTRRQTCVCSYRLISIVIHSSPFIQTAGIPPPPSLSSAVPYFQQCHPSTRSLYRRNRPRDVRRGDRQSCTYESCQSGSHTCTWIPPLVNDCK